MPSRCCEVGFLHSPTPRIGHLATNDRLVSPISDFEAGNSQLGVMHEQREAYPVGVQGLFKVVVAAWCRVDTPWVRYKRGGHG